MSQILLPPPEQSGERGPQGDTNDESHGTAHASVAVATSPATAGRTRGRDAAPRQPKWARAIKWPLHQLLKGIYLSATTIKAHRITSLVVFALVAGLLGSGAVVYSATHPAPTSHAGTPASTAHMPETPFTYSIAQPAPIPSSVINWLHGHKTFNAQELWSVLDTQAHQSFTQQGLDEKGLANRLAQEKASGLQFQQFIQTGGYVLPDGSANYSVQVVEVQGNQQAVLSWYFVVDQSGLIAGAYDLTPQAQG